MKEGVQRSRRRRHQLLHALQRDSFHDQNLL
jgi:hypothetical protein